VDFHFLLVSEELFASHLAGPPTRHLPLSFSGSQSGMSM
jgi:hypothetical protein